MTPSTILKSGEPGLREISRMADLSKYDSGIGKRLLASMTGAVGLAAPQIGLQLRIIAVRLSAFPAAIVMVNPTLTGTFGPRLTDWEGCLSLPGTRCFVPRYTHINVRWNDPERGLLEVGGTFSDHDARIIQHEVDHLDGRLMTDRARNTKRAA